MEDEEIATVHYLLRKYNYFFIKNIPWEYILLFLRAITLSIWANKVLSDRKISVFLQIIFALIIIVSDIFDGKISRRRGGEKEKIIFRIMDAIIDKLGILFFSVVLYVTGRCNLYFVLIFCLYNIIVGVAVWIIAGRKKDLIVEDIQATKISRLYALSIAILFLVMLNIQLDKNALCWVDIYFTLMAIAVFYSHKYNIPFLIKRRDLNQNRSQ